MRDPPFDDVYWMGVAWLDSIGREPETMNTTYVLVDESTRTDADVGGELAPSTLKVIAYALKLQLNAEFNQEWGGAYDVRVDRKENVAPDEVCVNIQDSLPDTPGAAGYHDRLPNGAAVVYIARDGSSSLTDGSYALSVTLSHELCETAADPGANQWADTADGTTEEALEVCDRVEDTFYEAPNGVCVSNFLLRSAFDPGAAAPYDYMGILTEQDGLTPGGYALERPAGPVSTVTMRGRLPKARRRFKGRPTCRTYRRGLR